MVSIDVDHLNGRSLAQLKPKSVFFSGAKSITMHIV